MSCKILSRKAEVASKRPVEPPNYSNGTICETTAPCSSRIAASCCIATDFAFHRRANPSLTGSAPVATHQLNFGRSLLSDQSTCSFRSSSTPLWQVWHPKVAPNSLRGHFFSGLWPGRWRRIRATEFAPISVRRRHRMHPVRPAAQGLGVVGDGGRHRVRAHRPAVVGLEHTD